jgi:general secretion pathway protein G
MTKQASQRGFSFIELLASVAILAILATVAVPVMENAVRRGKERELRSALNEIRTALDAYKAASAQGKILTRPEDSGYPATLLDLVIGMDDTTRPGGPKLKFLRRVPRDPFFADASVPSVDTWGLRSFASDYDRPSAGADVFDVYSKSSAVGLNGVPYSEW